MINKFHTWLIILGSVVVALCLSALPLPRWAQWMSPDWVWLVLVFWLLFFPHLLNIGCVFFIGLVQDLLNGTTLGHHAIVYLLSAGIIFCCRQNINPQRVSRQLILVVVLSCFYLVVNAWLLILARHFTNSIQYWLPILTNVLAWLVLGVILNRLIGGRAALA